MFGNRNYLTIALFLISVWLFGQDAFDQGVKAFNDKNYVGSIDLFLKDIEVRGRTQASTYNLGNAYLMNRDIPQAILSYERALLMGGGDEVEQNLHTARLQMDDEIPAFSDFFLLRFFRSLLTLVTPNMWAIVAILAWLTGLWFLYVLWFREGERSGLVLGLIGLALVATSLSYVGGRWLDHQVYAIVMDKGGIYEGSDERSEEMRQVGAGNKVRILDEIPDWLKVELPDKEQGWMKRSILERIK